MFTLEGKTMIISGASGKAPSPIVHMALKCGMNVCFMSGDHQKAMDGLAQIDPQYKDHIIGYAANPQYKLELNRSLAPDIYKPDATPHDVLRWIYERFGSIDVVVNGSGGGIIGGMGEVRGAYETDKDYWHRAACCPEDMFFNTLWALEYLEKSPSGRIINISCDDGYCGGWFKDPAAAAARGGVIALTRELARELGPKGITVNAVLHSHIEGVGVDGKPVGVLEEEERRNLIAHTPLGRMCTSEDLAGVVCFLASEEASFITGTVINVNGGLLMG